MIMTDRDLMLHRFNKKNIKLSTGVLARKLGLDRKTYEDAIERAMKDKRIRDEVETD